MSNAIETNQLTKRFGDVLAVDAIDLRVGTGEIYGFLGLNGAGKTTTIRALLGMIRPSFVMCLVSSSGNWSISLARES